MYSNVYSAQDQACSLLHDSSLTRVSSSLKILSNFPFAEQQATRSWRTAKIGAMAAEEGAEADTEAGKPAVQVGPFAGPVPKHAAAAAQAPHAPLVSPFAANSEMETVPSTPPGRQVLSTLAAAQAITDHTDAAAGPLTPQPQPAARLSASALTQALSSVGRMPASAQAEPRTGSVSVAPLGHGSSAPEAGRASGEACCQNEASSQQIGVAIHRAGQQTGGPAVAPASGKAESSTTAGAEKPEKKASGFNKDAKKYRGVRQRPWGKWAAGVAKFWASHDLAVHLWPILCFIIPSSIRQFTVPGMPFTMPGMQCAKGMAGICMHSAHLQVSYMLGQA